MFAEVVFPLPFRNSFTYSVPQELSGLLQVGVRVVAPFGKRTLTGFVINKTNKTEVKEKIKPILDVLDEIPIVNQKQFKFYEWLSEYYLCSLGEALRAAVPQGLEVESKKKIASDVKFCLELYEKEKNKNSLKAKILKILSTKDELNINTLQKAVKKKNIYSTLRSLEKVGAVTVVDTIKEARVKVKKVKFVKLNRSLDEIYESIPVIEKRSPKQVALLLELINCKGEDIEQAKLLKKTDSSLSSLNSLFEKGLIDIFDKEVDRFYIEGYNEEINNFILTKDQQSIIDTVVETSGNNKFHPYLLYGVTGSGKTQVYIEIVKKVLSEDKTALVLVPEISLTPQITSRLYNNFGDTVTVLHSRMSLGERFDSWRRILSGKSCVVVGARSALFAPLENLGLIVVDEEHDSSYKQFDLVPKYHARDAAIMRGYNENCPVLLGSATPSIESMYNSEKGKYTLLRLTDRVDNAKMPHISLVNIRIEAKKKKMENVFSRVLIDRIEDRLKKNEGIIILQNRRGFSTQVYCTDCGELETCTQCSVTMVYHINQNILQCHYCGNTTKVPNACTHCGSIAIKYLGAGTERVEDELEYYFPDAKIERIDSDTISRKGLLSEILNNFRKGEIDILVGTQMVSKGLDFSRVTLVGVISAETSLWLPDFRADERTFQLLTQVAGRSGRSKVEGEVIIQTQNEKHFALQKVLFNDYEGFYKKEIFDREKMGYPPFTRLALIETKDADEKKAVGAINDFYRELNAYRKHVTITPPSVAMIARLKGEYRYQVLIKSSRINDAGGGILRKAILNSYINFNRNSRFSNVKLIIDIDPQSIL